MVCQGARFRSRIAYKALSTFIAFAFIFTTVLPPGYAQVGAQNFVPLLPVPGTMVMVSPAFTPPIMLGMTLHPDNPLQFDFIIDTGDENLQGDAFEQESKKLVNYFLATLTVPDDELWVNLSPYEKDRVIAEGLAVTEMGRDMLVQDYLLKQLTASLMYPEEELGEEFWKKVYAKTQAKFGTTEIPTNTFNKVWIVPDEASVYINARSPEGATNVFVNKSHLKVLLEEDYLALESNKDNTKHGLGNMAREDINIINQEAKEIVREVILPAIEKEVNEGKNFANLRQIYHSMILATWYKRNLKQSILGQVYMDTNKIEGIDLEDKNIKEKVYNQYVEAFKKGVYNYIREDYDPATQEMIPRKYFSGGIKNLGSSAIRKDDRPSDRLVARAGRPENMIVSVAANLIQDNEETSPAKLLNAASPVRILIADDMEEEQTKAKEKALKVFPDAEFVITNDGQEAVDKYKAGDFDLVLLDGLMPKVIGFDAAIAIREKNPNATIILNTSDLTDIDPEAFLDIFTGMTLKKKLTEALEKVKERVEASSERREKEERTGSSPMLAAIARVGEEVVRELAYNANNIDRPFKDVEQQIKDQLSEKDLRSRIREHFNDGLKNDKNLPRYRNHMGIYIEALARKFEGDRKDLAPLIALVETTIKRNKDAVGIAGWSVDINLGEHNFGWVHEILREGKESDLPLPVKKYTDSQMHNGRSLVAHGGTYHIEQKFYDTNINSSKRASIFTAIHSRKGVIGAIVRKEGTIDEDSPQAILEEMGVDFTSSPLAQDIKAFLDTLFGIEGKDFSGHYEIRYRNKQLMDGVADHLIHFKIPVSEAESEQKIEDALQILKDSLSHEAWKALRKKHPEAVIDVYPGVLEQTGSDGNFRLVAAQIYNMGIDKLNALKKKHEKKLRSLRTGKSTSSKDVDLSLVVTEGHVKSVKKVIKLKNSQSASPAKSGGIDFNPNAMTLSEEGQALDFQFDPVNMPNIPPDSVQGIVPVIINITPISTIAPLLGLMDESAPKDQHVADEESLTGFDRENFT